MTPRDYKLFLTWMQRFGLYAPAIIMTAAPLLFLFAFESSPGEPPDKFVYFFWLFAAAYWAGIVQLPHRIRVLPTDELEFVSVLRRQVVAVGEIESIKPGGTSLFVPIGGLSLFTLKHRQGKIRFVHQFTGMRMLLTEIHVANSKVQLIGC